MPPVANDPARNELDQWDRVKAIIGRGAAPLPPGFSAMIRQDPGRWPRAWSSYKFAAKMIGAGKRVLELGCGDGAGCPLLAEFASVYLGVEPDAALAAAAQTAWGNERRSFVAGPVLGKAYGMFDVVAMLDTQAKLQAIYQGQGACEARWAPGSTSWRRRLASSWRPRDTRCWAARATPGSAAPCCGPSMWCCPSRWRKGPSTPAKGRPGTIVS